MANKKTASSDELENDELKNMDESLEEELGNESEKDKIAALQAQIDKLNAENAKQRKLRQKAYKERDELKSTTNKDDDDKSDSWQKLYEKERAARESLESKAKDASINAAVSQQLAKVGILPNAIKAATKLMDKDLIEWDPQDGVDKGSVEAAIAQLKYDHKFLFESNVNATKPKTPGDGKDKSSKEMTRAEFDKLSHPARAQRIQDGYKIVD